jgi:predicted ArsR family transcriptional regulator
MATMSETSDQALLDLLRRRGPMSIAELMQVTEVTANAVRQRLTRLMGQGLVDRAVVGRVANPSDQGSTPSEANSQEGKPQEAKPQRGRPTHQYRLTDKARRQAGDNFADLAMVLWREVRAVKEPSIRRGLLQRVADAMAKHYQGLVAGATLPERMQSLAAVFAERRVPVSVTETSGEAQTTDPAHRSASGERLPVLVVEDCPYPQLAEEDRGICAVEKMMFSQLLSEDVRLTQCRLDGHNCCQFETT